jgi:hypothetical protein
VVSLKNIPFAIWETKPSDHDWLSERGVLVFKLFQFHQAPQNYKIVALIFSIII